MRFIDFDGMAIYHINSSGVITFSEENTEIHRLYLLNEDGSRSDKYITLSNSDAMSALQQKDPDNKNEISSYTSGSNINDMFNIFLFAADNTTVEWALHRGQDNSYTIGTLHDDKNAGNWEDYGIQKPIASVHSHPGITAEHITEIESMGYWYNGTYPAGDWENVIKDVNSNGYQTRMNYVYFPISTRLYHVGYRGAAYIREISNYKKFYFGTLNHK